MAFATLVVKEGFRQLTAQISRPESANSLNQTLIRELHQALDWAEATPDGRTFVLEGLPGVFCTGLDFHDAAEPASIPSGSDQATEYFRLLKRLTLSPRIVVCRVDGKVIAGGIGLVAASDIVLATARAEFSLPEALWGLLPCCVLPFLLRRLGYQKAYFLTLTTRPMTAAEAFSNHLVDELSENLDDAIRKLSLRLNLLDDRVILDLKHYFQQIAGISPEIEKIAVQEINRLAGQTYVRENINNYIQRGVLPWEKRPI
ncbi:MAG TPA: enoyl-CoA hydratase-related protein [Chthoniobacterales bacterium]